MKKVLSVKDAKLGVAGGSAATTEAMPTTASTIEELKAIVMLTNRLACSFNEGRLNTCILTSYALAASLADLGYADARPVRVRPQAPPMTASSMVSALAALTRRVFPAAAQETIIGRGI